MPKRWKIGRKQPVLRKNCPKKKSKFKGVQKQTKVPVELARNAAAEITFVGEGNVVSEQIPPPAASAWTASLKCIWHKNFFFSILQFYIHKNRF